MQKSQFWKKCRLAPSGTQGAIYCIYFNQRTSLFGIGVIPSVQGSIFWHMCKISNATYASSSPVYILNIAKISSLYVDNVLINMSNERLIAITLVY